MVRIEDADDSHRASIVAPCATNLPQLNDESFNKAGPRFEPANTYYFHSGRLPVISPDVPSVSDSAPLERAEAGCARVSRQSAAPAPS